MKAGLWCLIAFFLMGCAANPHAAGGETPGKQIAKIYFEGEGPERDVKRFQKFLQIAFDDFGLAPTDSARDADATIKMRFSHEDDTEYLYSPVVWMTFISLDHQQYVEKSCNTVSTQTSVFDEPIKYLSKVTIPAKWKKRNPRFTIYINDQEVKGHKELLPTVNQSLTQDGYQIARQPANADAELQSIKLERQAVPMRTSVFYRHYEVFDRQSKLFYSTSGKGASNITHLDPEPGIKTENLPCGSTVKNFGADNDGSWGDARDIAKAIREHLDKATHSN
jgi:hypothetical protein